MKLYRTRTLAGFVYFSDRDTAAAEWKVERDCTVPFRRYTVCRVQLMHHQGRLWTDWLIEHDALTLKDARNFITANQINPNNPYIDDTADGADDTFGL